MKTLKQYELSAISGGEEAIDQIPPRPPYTPPPPPPPAPSPTFNVYAAPGIDPACEIELAR
ncbi:hypothetical protein [Oleiharenicola sp. Vm1]|uniref:hypothetical protein n=1 Tax=Oleiharenicola sp. Vm1 TaxID=3398393 RepID=UPI0039F46CA9